MRIAMLAGTVRGRHGRVSAAAGVCLAGAAWGQLSVGPNVNISHATGEQAEAAITINPTNPLNLFCNYNNLQTSNMWGGVSMDGGTTWAIRAVGTGSDGLSASIGDPSSKFDRFGNLFLCHITTAGTIQVGLSTTGGNTFSTVTTFSGGSDQPTITTGPSSTAGLDSAWVCFNQTSGQRISGINVSGFGSLVGAFSALVLAPSSNSGISGNFGDIAVGPVGQVAVSYQNANSAEGPDSVYFNLDPDGLMAAAFGARITVTPINVGGFETIPAQPSRTVDSEIGMGFDRTGGPFNGRLYMVYTDETAPENNDTNIMLRISNNNGTTWSPAVKLNDDVTTRSQFLPKLVVDRVTGHVAVIWYDSRNSAGNNTAEIWGTASLDGGATWLPNVKISAGVSTAVGGSSFDYGDYTGLDMHNDVFYPVWSDNSNSTGNNPNGTGAAMDIYTARVSIAAVCYANCDASTTPPVLNVQDFGCYLNRYAAGDTYANCDGSTTPPVLNVQDFGCFLNLYAAGCS
jgi:hypothetical protein